MATARVRFGSIIEWMVAAAVLVAALAIGSTIVRESRTVSAVMPVSAREANALDPPAGVPSRAVSVPILLFGDNKEVRVGDSAADIATELGASVDAGSPSVELGPAGERTTRYYLYMGTRFVLVFEPDARGTEPVVVAIYRQ